MLAGLLGLSPCSQAAPAPPTGSPHQLIDRLGVTLRGILEDPAAQTTPAEAERAVAGQISALVARSPGHLSLTETDGYGRTPLMLAASGGYPQVVQALLADPGVRLAINQPDLDGETAWMLANFAPAATLMACEPGTLTIERYALLPPYLRRLASLVKPDLSALASIVGNLEAAGAEVKPEAAKRAWLERCPNAAPELRQALDSGELLPTLLRDSLNRLGQFNKVASDKPKSLPPRPPDDMKFVHGHDDDKPAPERTALLDIRGMSCTKMPPPEMPKQIYWAGSISLRAVVVTRAGVVEGADFYLLSGPNDKRLIAGFRNLLLQTLAKYQCYGDHVFEQEFAFDIR